MDLNSLVSEYHPSLNTREFSSFSPGSHTKVWWLGACGHEWESMFYSRAILNSQCPYCTNKKVLSGFNDVATVRPELIPFWSESNESKTTEVLAYSKLDVLWVCSLGHLWEASPSQMVKRKVVCKECLSLAQNHSQEKHVVPSKSPRAKWSIFNYPTLVKQFDYALNDKKPEDVNSNTMVWWVCPQGHSWQSSASRRTRKGVIYSNCSVCKDNSLSRKSLAVLRPELASEWHPIKNNGLTPEMFTLGSAQKIWWLCSKDESHVWEAYIYARAGVSNSSCPKCAAGNPASIAAESPLLTWFTSLNVTVSPHHKLPSGQELDVFFPDNHIALGFNDVYWHDENHKIKSYHYDKWLAARALGIQLIQIWEDDWNRNPDLVKTLLLHKLGLSNQIKTFARKTSIVELATSETREFLTENHIQGFASGSYYLGLRDNDKQKLVALMVLRKEPNNTLNIVRYATSQQVVGGFTKLLKHAERTYTPKRFITFADHTISDGGLYENNGFVADKELPPDYTYVVKGERKHKFGYRLKRFRNDPELLWEEGLSERELALLNNLPRIWDAGKTRYVRTII